MEDERHVLFEAIPECHCGAVFNGFREAHEHITTETIARLASLNALLMEALERFSKDDRPCDGVGVGEYAYCKTHSWSLPCPVEQAREALGRGREGSLNHGR